MNEAVGVGRESQISPTRPSKEIFASFSKVVTIGRSGRRILLIEGGMAKPVIFTVSAVWDGEANVWSGHCDDLPAAADGATLDELLEKMSRMALDVAPDNHPEVDLESIFIQITALREAIPAAA
jgi:hypothetical protein